MEEEKKEQEIVDTEEYRGKPLGFFKKLWYSITKFEKYPEMAAEGVGRAFKYLIQIMLIFCVILCVGMVAQLYGVIQKGVESLQNNFPDISYKDGVLVVDSKEPIIVEDTNTVVGKVIIDTKVTEQNEINKYIQSIGKEESGVVLLQEKVIVKNKALAEPITYNYKDIMQGFNPQEITEFTKQDIIEFANSTKMISFYLAFFLVMFIYLIVIYLLATMIDAFILSILGYVTTVFARLRMKYVAIYNMSIYALTLSILLNSVYIVVNMFTGFEITYFQVMYTSVAYIYLVAAIFLIKSDFIKKQMELMKIIEEQEKVREELKVKEAEKEEKKEQEEKKEEPEKKEKENKGNKESKDKKDGIDAEPEGSNA